MDLTILNQSILIGNYFFIFHSRQNYFKTILFSIALDNDLNSIVQKFSEHYHDAWANRKLENGWVYGEQFNDVNKSHPRLKPYMMLSEYVSFDRFI